MIPEQFAECVSGTRPKPGQPDYFLYNTAGAFGAFGEYAGWLTNWGMGIPATPQRTSEFCSVAPGGAQPTAADWAALAFPAIALATGVYERFGNMVRQTEFANRCECAPLSGVGCISRSTVVSFQANSVAVSACGQNSWYTDGNQPAYVFPAGQHRVRVRILDRTTTHDLQVDWYSRSGGEHCFVWAAGTTLDATFNATALTDPHMGLAFRDAGARPIWLEGATVLLDFMNAPGEADCAPAGTPFTPPVVPPPPPGFPLPPTLTCGTQQDICNALNALSQNMDILRMQVQLLQRWGKPFAYVHGQTYTDLSGTGSVQISRLLGMSVYVVEPPPNEPVLPGNPPYLWDCGWMSISNADGMLEEKRVTRSGFDWFPRDMPLATWFNWALTPGTVVRAVELRTEP